MNKTNLKCSTFPGTPRLARTLRCAALAAALALPAAPPLGADTGSRQERAAPAERLTLRQAVTLALAHSPELALARARHDVSERAEDLSRSAFQPNLYTGSGAAYTNGFPLGAPTVFNLSYVQTLFNRPARGEARAAGQEAEMRRAAVDRARDAVILRTAAAYLELAQVSHSLELLARETSSAEKVLEVTRQRAAEGLELPIEVTRMQLVAARVAQRIAQLETRAGALEAELAGLTGLPPGRGIEVSADDLAFLEGGPEPVARLVEQALASDPQLREAEFQRRAAEERLKGERGGYLPSLDVVGQYGVFTRFNNYDKFYNRFERHNVTVGVQVRIPIFSARTSAAVGLAQSRVAAAELELRNRRAEVERDIRQQARRGREVEASREVARLELELAQQNVRALQAQFEEGRASLRDLERARLEELERWRQFLETDYARQQARLELLRATGQLARMFP